VRISEAEIETIIQAHKSRNEALRQTFISKGVDLGEPRMIECHFWAWSGDDAAGLAEALTMRGFRILVQRPAASPKDPSLWNVEAGVHQSVELTMRIEFTDELVRIAVSHSARYDGWGTSI
jgi:hypothetical protein